MTNCTMSKKPGVREVVLDSEIQLFHEHVGRKFWDKGCWRIKGVHTEHGKTVVTLEKEQVDGSG